MSLHRHYCLLVVLKRILADILARPAIIMYLCKYIYSHICRHIYYIYILYILTIAVCALDMWLFHGVELRREPVATRTGTLLNIAALASDAGLDSVRTTVRRLRSFVKTRALERADPYGFSGREWVAGIPDPGEPPFATVEALSRASRHWNGKTTPGQMEPTLSAIWQMICRM